jgi:hypothetical protein
MRYCCRQGCRVLFNPILPRSPITTLRSIAVITCSTRPCRIGHLIAQHVTAQLRACLSQLGYFTSFSIIVTYRAAFGKIHPPHSAYGSAMLLSPGSVRILFRNIVHKIGVLYSNTTVSCNNSPCIYRTFLRPINSSVHFSLRGRNRADLAVPRKPEQKPEKHGRTTTITSCQRCIS